MAITNQVILNGVPNQNKTVTAEHILAERKQPNMKKLLFIFLKFNIIAEILMAVENKYGKLPNAQVHSDFKTFNIYQD